MTFEVACAKDVAEHHAPLVQIDGIPLSFLFAHTVQFNRQTPMNSLHSKINPENSAWKPLTTKQ